MHFFYLDESGCTGCDLTNADQPIFVLGGISVRDEGWNQTHERYVELLSRYFDGSLPPDFELHACDLLSPDGTGHFSGHPRSNRNKLATHLLDLVISRRHEVHFMAIDKAKLLTTNCHAGFEYDHRIPYLLAYDSLISHIEYLIKKRLGRSARAMVILDAKEQFSLEIDQITSLRRFNGPRANRIKRIVEFSYPIDSETNPMIQLSDLVAYCTKRFLEIDLGYRSVPAEAAHFYAECFKSIFSRVTRKSIARRRGGTPVLHSFVEEIQAKPTRTWRTRHTFIGNQ